MEHFSMSPVHKFINFRLIYNKPLTQTRYPAKSSSQIRILPYLSVDKCHLCVF